MADILFQTDPIENFYDIREELGRGNFAVVKRCTSKGTGVEYAAKCITKKRSKTSKRGMSKEAVEIEAKVLLALNHEAIIRLYDVFETRTNITLVMELLTGGELFEEIAKKEFILERDACFYTKQVLSAIQHMHSQNIVHLDLKPENIVLKYPESKEIKLIDFGLAKILDPDKELREMMGTPEFSAPEVINYDPVGPFTDMWAIGVVTYVLLSGASPFLGDDDQETYHNITSCDYRFDDEYFEKITENAKDFIRKLLTKDTKKRNTINDCLDHPWIASEDEENSVIDTQKMRAFVARRRWKQSLKLVATISRLRMLCRNSSPSPPSDFSSDEVDAESGKNAKNSGCKDEGAKLPNFTNKTLLQEVVHASREQVENDHRSTHSSEPSDENVCAADDAQGKGTSGEEGQGSVPNQNQKDVSLVCNETRTDNVADDLSFKHECTYNDSSVNARKRDRDIEWSKELSLNEREQSLDCKNSGSRPDSQVPQATVQVVFSGSSAESCKQNNLLEGLNKDSELEPRSPGSVLRHQLELMPSEEAPVTLKLAFDTDSGNNDSTTKSEASFAIEDIKNELEGDASCEEIHKIEACSVHETRRSDLAVTESRYKTEEQNVVLAIPHHELISSGFQSEIVNIARTESQPSSKTLSRDEDNVIVVERNMNRPISFKLDLNISQDSDKTELVSLERSEKLQGEKTVDGDLVPEAKEDNCIYNTSDRSTVNATDVASEVETTAAPSVNLWKDKSETNADSRTIVVSKNVAEITVNGKADSDKGQIFNTINVGLATGKAVKTADAQKELSNPPVTREILLEDDDDMVVIEMIQQENNNC